MLNGGASMIYHFMDEEDVDADHAASDGGGGVGRGHQRRRRTACRTRAAIGNTARVLGEYVRERKVLSLEEAVRKMTSLPAEFFKFEGRGVIREGAVADLVLFDPATVKDLATYASPQTFPAGIPHVLVNGVFVVRDGKTTGARPGTNTPERTQVSQKSEVRSQKCDDPFHNSPMPTPYAHYVGDQDPVALLASTLEEYRAAVSGLSAAAWNQPWEPGKWTLRQIVVHVTQWEMIFGYRLRVRREHAGLRDSRGRSGRADGADRRDRRPNGVRRVRWLAPHEHRPHWLVRAW